MVKKEKDLEIGKRIATGRLQRGLSQVMVSRRAGIDPSYLSRIEKGKIHPTVRMASKIATAMRIPLRDLLEPSPSRIKGLPCPVSKGGQCLLDLLDLGGDSGKGGKAERFTTRQLRLIRRFTELVQNSETEVMKAMEVLVGGMLEAR